MYLLKYSICVIVLFFLFVTANAQNSWLAKQTFPGEAREGAVSFVIGNYAYVGLGFSNNGVKKDFWRYNPQNNTWNQMASFGGDARTNAVAFVLNNNAYVGTGEGVDYQKFKDFWKYDVSKNTWTKVADFGGSARSGAVAFTLNNNAYLGTGEDATGTLNDLWEYDPAKDVWTQKADIPCEKRKDAVAFAINNSGYICSGWSGGNASFGDILEYTASKDTWITRITSDRSLYNKQFSEVFILANKAYLIGGYNINTIVVYDPSLSSLQSEGNFNPAGETLRKNLITFSVNGKVYVGLGLTDNAYPRNDLWMYGTSPDAPVNLTAKPLDNSNILLNWTDNSLDEDYFTIEKSDGNNSLFIEIAIVAANTTSFKSSALKDTSKYFYRVKAANKAGFSGYSNEAFATTFSLYPPKTSVRQFKRYLLSDVGRCFYQRNSFHY
jgi:N-acetylneuraminic acid mutarotase